MEDHPVFREGLSRLLREEKDLLVCGEASNAVQALKLITKLKPDLVAVDINLPGKSGLELIKEIRKLKLPVKMLAVSMYSEAVFAQRVLRAGGHGYVMKEEDPEVIVLAIRDILAGRVYVSDEVFDKKAGETPRMEASVLDRLTDTELEVLESFGHRKSTREISKQAGLSIDELSAVSENIRAKLKLKDLDGLVKYAVKWVEGNQ